VCERERECVCVCVCFFFLFFAVLLELEISPLQVYIDKIMGNLIKWHMRLTAFTFSFWNLHGQNRSQVFLTVSSPDVSRHKSSNTPCALSLEAGTRLKG
jgi:hypothetical protein